MINEILFLGMKSPIKNEPVTPVVSQEIEPQRIEIESSPSDTSKVSKSPQKRRSNSSPEEEGGSKKRRVTKPK